MESAATVSCGPILVPGSGIDETPPTVFRELLEGHRKPGSAGPFTT